ncbi:MAG: ABC-2 family transporter protein [Candidatus Micrarchaeaceae archaeon]
MKVYMKNVLAYRGEFALSIFFSVLAEFVYMFVWIAVYAFSGITSLYGIPLSSMIVYFFVLGGLNFMAWPIIADTLEDGIRGGGIATFLIRPFKYSYALFASILPYNLLSMALGAMPILIAVYIIFGLHTGAVALLAFAAEVVLAFAIINMIGFIVGALSVYITDIYGIMQGFYVIFLLLGGGLMPLTLYPKLAYAILMLTPFPYLYYIPAGIFTGIITVGALPSIFAIGVAWFAVLAVLGELMWRRVSMALNAVGV